jgi:Glu-tRNA(Gln) amidotransferase subunit E-like FAD-binding protein
MEAAWSRESRYREWGIPEDCVGPMAASPWAETFDNLVKNYNVDPRIAATLLMHRVKGWRRRGWPVDKLTPNDVERAFALYRQGVIIKEAIAESLASYLTTQRPLRQILNGLARRRDAEKRLSESVARAKRRVRKRVFRNGSAAVKRYAMGMLMEEFRGLLPAATVLQAVEKNILPAFAAVQTQEGKK